MKQQHILESNAEANCPTQTQTDNTAVSDETYSPDLSTSPTSSETPVTAYDDKNRNGYDELQAETNNHELLHTPTTTSGYEIAGNGSDNDAAQVNSTSAYPTTTLASPQPLAEEEPTNDQGNDWQL